MIQFVSMNSSNDMFQKRVMVNYRASKDVLPCYVESKAKEVDKATHILQNLQAWRMKGHRLERVPRARLSCGRFIDSEAEGSVEKFLMYPQTRQIESRVVNRPKISDSNFEDSNFEESEIL